MLLGTDQIRKWAWMASLADLGRNRPRVLMAQVLMRGRFSEAIAHASGLSAEDSDPFLAGMFSLLDAILGRPLREVLDDLNIGDTIRNVLLTTEDVGTLFLILKIVKAYEVGDWNTVEETAKAIQISPSAIGACYLESLSWVDAVFVDENPAHPMNSLIANSELLNDSHPRAVRPTA